MADGYWQSGTDDQVMQDEHLFMWQAMVDTVDRDLAGARVLDVGCNRGGFLRLLRDRCGIASGNGYDPAGAAIADAERLAGDGPLTFAVSDTVPDGWSGFDVAFSHEVLYLLHDLPAHGRDLLAALAPGGVYYAVTGLHADSPTMADWHRQNAQALDLPGPYRLNDIVAAFEQAGFSVAVSRLRVGFVPTSGHATSFPEALDYFYEHKVMFRFAKGSPDRS